MIPGNTVFVGDSITVGLPPFVEVAGQKTSIAKGGRSTAQILAAVTSPEARPLLTDARNMVVLGGTNDIAGGLSAQVIFFNLVAIWTTGSGKGLRIIALTIPPIRGYAGYPNPQAAETKRRDVNAMILASTLPAKILDCDRMMGDGAAFPALLPKFDGGDHLHPNRQAMGAAMNVELAGLGAAPAPRPSGPGTVPSGAAGSGRSGAVLALELGAGAGISWGLWKFAKSKGWL